MNAEPPVTIAEPDMEIAALGQIDRILKTLEPAGALRAVRWLSERYGTRGLAPAVPGAGAGGESSLDVADLFTRANPVTQDQKALVVGYWFQVMNESGDLDAQAINTALKQLGHGMKNITAAFDHLISARPQLVIQVRKSGNSKQARKRYRLTTEGIRRVRAMLESGGTQE